MSLLPSDGVFQEVRGGLAMSRPAVSLTWPLRFPACILASIQVVVDSVSQASLILSAVQDIWNP